MLKVTFEEGMRFRAEARGHAITVDLEPEKGGTDKGMGPLDALDAALGTCIGVYVVAYCNSVHIDTAGITIEVQSEKTGSPTRIGRMQAVITVPGGVPEERREGLMRVAHNCIVHQTLTNPPEVSIELK